MQTKGSHVTPAVRLVWQADCLLGEGPVWLAEEQALRFVDIKRGRLHRFVPSTGTCETLVVGGKPSFILPNASGGFLVGSEHAVWTLEDGQLVNRVTIIDQPAHNRTNDGTVDTQGRLWFGTMDDDEQQSTGELYCIDRHGIHKMGCRAVVTNGPAITPDGKTLYHVDSGNRTIWRYTIGEGPSIKDGAVFLLFDETDGYPDGITLDSEGCLWVALWDGWSVRRYAPDGSLLVTVDFPCARVTKIAFGGEDLRTAYVTTARIGLSTEDLRVQPLGGSLFAFEVGVPGFAISSFVGID
jgi:xylono-1,5-lactonase